MRGRKENKRKMELKIQEKIVGYPKYLKEFYYSLVQKSHTTKLRYINNAIRFIDEVDFDDLSDITSNTIQMYLNNIECYEENGEIKEITNTTKACICSSLCAFFNFLKMNNYIEENPFSKIERPKIDNTEITFLTPEEVKIVEERILQGVGNQTAKSKQAKWKYRDLLLFRIPVVCGLRVTSLSEIDIDDIDMKNNTIMVTEKGNITKKIYLDDKTMMYINMWLIDREKLINDSKCKIFFISNRKERITVRSIERIIEKYTQDIDGKHITPHKLRSTCGTNLYQNKKDIYLVASVLGHKTTAPTQRYAKIFDEDKINAINSVAAMYN